MGDDHESCTPLARAFAVEQLTALTCATTAELLDVIVDVDRAGDFRDDGSLDMPSWLVATLNVSISTAREWVRVGHALRKLPHLRACYAAAELSFDQIAAATRFATPDTDQHLAQLLPGCSAAQIDEMARQRTTRTRHDAQRAHEARGLRWRRDHQRDGYRYSGFLPVMDAELVNASLERRANAAGPDAETGLWAPFHQRTADSLVELCRQDVTADPGPDPTLVVVHIDDDVLRGTVAGNGSTVDGTQIPVDTIRRVLCDGPVEVQVDGPDGTCVGISRIHRNPPRWLRRRILRRDRAHCRFPGCGRKARQIHHVRWWHRDHGPTDTWNLAGLCWAHHHLVHEGGWTIKGNADHELTFTSPHGRKLTSRPPPLLPATRQHIADTTGLQLGPNDVS